MTDTQYGTCTCQPDQCSEGNGTCLVCDTIDPELPCPVADAAEAAR